MKFTMKNEVTGEVREVYTGPMWYTLIPLANIVIALIRKQGKLTLLNTLIVGLIGYVLLVVGALLIFFLPLIGVVLFFSTYVLLITWYILLIKNGNNHSYNKYVEMGYEIDSFYAENPEVQMFKNPEVQMFVKRSETTSKFLIFFV